MNLLVNMDSWFNTTSLSAVAVTTTVSVATYIAYRWLTSPMKHSTEILATNFAAHEIPAVEPSFSEDSELEVISLVLSSSALDVDEVTVLEFASVEPPSPAMTVEEVVVLDVDSIEPPSPAKAVEDTAMRRKLKKSRRKVDARSKETAQQRKVRNAQRMAERLAEEADEQSAFEEAIAMNIARNAAILGAEFMFQRTHAGWRSDWEVAYNEGFRKSDQAEECSICIEELVYEPGIGAKLSCSHRFHTSCLKPWIERNKTCPLCRHPIW